MVHGAQEGEQHAPPTVLPLLWGQVRAVADHHREQRPHAAVSDLRPYIRAEVLHQHTTKFQQAWMAPSDMTYFQSSSCTPMLPHVSQC
jgi:hypothetical protein